MSVPTFTASGAAATTKATLPKSVFAVEVANHEALKSAYVTYLSNGRSAAAKTKTRGLVSGGGKKPWKQKGTGRARFGSSRNPIWRGGGIVFGPTGLENYTKKINVETKRLAIRQALTLKATAGAIRVIAGFEFEAAKTRDVASFLGKIEATGRVLVVVKAKNEQTERATRNIQDLTVRSARYLNVFELLNADTIVIEKDAIAVVEEWLGGAV